MTENRAEPDGGDSIRPAVYVVLPFVQIGFASFAVYGKGVLSYVHPLAVAGVRAAFAGPILLLIAWIVERTKPTARDLRELALLGFIGVFLNQILFILGLRYTTATNTSILMPSIPVFAAAAAAILGVEALTPKRMLGIVLAVGGALVMLNPARFETSTTNVLGNLMILANAASYGTFLVLARPISKRLPPLTLMAWSSVFGGIMLLTVTGGELARMPFDTFPGWVRWGLVYIVVVPTIICHSANVWAVRHSTPTLVAAYTTLQPLAAAILAMIFLGESAGWAEAAGFVLIIAGLFVISRERAAPQPPIIAR